MSMNDSRENLFDCVREALAQHGLDDLFTLAVTHCSASEASAQLIFANLGLLGIRLALVWNHLRFGLPRDSAHTTNCMSEFNRSREWVLAFTDEDALSILRVGKGLRKEELPFKVKRQFVSAVLGACFFADTASACEITINHFAPLFGLRPDTQNPKSQLQQYCQRKHHEAPVYSVVSERGPDHDKEFVVAVDIPGVRTEDARGCGTTKKAAEQAAANTLLRSEGIKPHQPKRFATFDEQVHIVYRFYGADRSPKQSPFDGIILFESPHFQQCFIISGSRHHLSSSTNS